VQVESKLAAEGVSGERRAQSSEQVISTGSAEQLHGGSDEGTAEVEGSESPSRGHDASEL
jgi:hypothetical protein